MVEAGANGIRRRAVIDRPERLSERKAVDHRLTDRQNPAQRPWTIEPAGALTGRGNVALLCPVAKLAYGNTAERGCLGDIKREIGESRP